MNQAYESASFVRCVVPETADIQAASAAVAANPESGDAWMKKGHALAKVSMMREAEECYAMAISCDPFNWEYYRHRAHRFLSCWRFEDAAADFVIASRLNPNDWNVFYHLGLSYFLLRDYAKAAKAYARCYELTDAEPELIAVTDWYYMTLKRLGNDEEAAKILARITDHMNPGENTAYYARLLMYKGLKKPEELLSTDPEEVTALELITMGFGIANYFLQNGQPDKAYDLMERVVKAGDENDCYFAFRLPRLQGRFGTQRGKGETLSVCLPCCLRRGEIPATKNNQRVQNTLWHSLHSPYPQRKLTSFPFCCGRSACRRALKGRK